MTDMPFNIWAGTTLQEKTCGGWYKKPCFGYREPEQQYINKAQLVERLGGMKEYDFSPLHSSKNAENEYYEGRNNAIDEVIKMLEG